MYMYIIWREARGYKALPRYNEPPPPSIFGATGSLQSVSWSCVAASGIGDQLFFPFCFI